MQVKYAHGHLGNGFNNSTKLTLRPSTGMPIIQSVSVPLPAHTALPQGPTGQAQPQHFRTWNMAMSQGVCELPGVFPATWFSPLLSD